MLSDLNWECPSGTRLRLRSLDSLLQSYGQADLEINGRNREKIGVQRLSEELHPQNSISKDDYGKPYLESGPFINYSHSSSHLLWGENDQHEIGVDIENERPQLIKLQSKFCSSEELEFIDDQNPMTQLLLIWSAKESIYKAYGRKQLDFKLHMHLNEFKLAEEGVLNGTLSVQEKKSLQVFYKRFEKSVATWCVLR